MDLKEIWERIFKNPVDFDLSVLSDDDFREVVTDIQRRISNRIEVDWQRKRIRINFQTLKLSGLTFSKIGGIAHTTYQKSVVTMNAQMAVISAASDAPLRTAVS